MPPPTVLEILLDAVAGLVVEVFAALEHHVLEDVRGAGGARDFVARPDAIGHLKRDDRRGVVGLEQHLEPVGIQTVLVDTAERLDVGESGGLAGPARWPGQAPLRRVRSAPARQRLWRAFV